MSYGEFGTAPDLDELLDMQNEMTGGSTVPGTDPEPRKAGKLSPVEQLLAPVPGSVPRFPEPGTAENRSPYVDIAAMLDGTLPEPPAPTALRRSDGRCLFYAGQVNWVFGDPESGKTWVCLACVAECLIAGGRALVIDLDHNGAAATVSRLLSLGAPAEALKDPNRFRYTEPDDRIELLTVVEDMSIWAPGVAVVDSVGELLPLFGTSSNSADDFTAVHTRVLKPLAKSGAAVLAIDHLAKNQDSRAHGPGGTAAKRRAIGGVSLRVKVKDAFTPGKGGSAYLGVNKDRHGGLRAHCPTGDREPLAGVFNLSAWADDVLTWEVKAPAEGDRNPDESAPPSDIAAVDALDPPPQSVDDARERLRWNKQRAARAVKAWREQQSS